MNDTGYDERVEKLALARIRRMYVDGDYFTGGLGPNGFDPRDYATENPATIRRFQKYLVLADFSLRGSPPRPLYKTPHGWVKSSITHGSGLPFNLNFVTHSGEECLVAVHPRSHAFYNPAFQYALTCFIDDLRLEYRRRAARLIKHPSVLVKMSHLILNFRTEISGEPLTTAEMVGILHSLAELKRTAFTFGEKGAYMFLTFYDGKGGRTAFLLRPPRLMGTVSPQMAKNPPLPSYLWRWLRGLPVEPSRR